MPSSRASLSLDDLQRIDALCDRFEAEFRSGAAPDLDAYLNEVGSALEADLLLPLLKLQLELRSDESPAPDFDTYARRFPQHAEALRSLWQSTTRRSQASTISHSPAAGETWPPARAHSKAWPAIPGYDILGELGGGGMGVVYKARHLRLNRIVALKTILHGGQHRRDLVERFRREAEAVARLQHPNIVQIYDFGEADGVPYFSMEYVEGADLREALKDKPLPEKPATRLVETLARTMHVVHQQRIVHRDLKPANVLLTSVGQESGVSGQGSAGRGQEADTVASVVKGTGRATENISTQPLGVSHTASTTPSPLTPDPCLLTPKISDFGLAKALDANDGQTGTDTVVGTPSYMAPEQAQGGKGPISAATDVYALGAILYECIVGRPPFKAESALETIMQVLEQEPVPPRQFMPKLSSDLETICLKCLSKDPAKRYTTALALAEDLRRFQDEEPILARPAGPAERTWKWVRRHPRLVGAAAAIFLSLVAGIIGTSLGLIEARRESTRAALEEQNAKTESERAKREEKKARDLLAAGYVQHAQLAAQRGQWRSALEQIDKALEAGHPDSTALFVQRVKALVALNDPLAFKETEKLAALASPGPHEGDILLLRGDVALLTDHGKALPLLEQALQKKLQPADRAYVEGLLAGSTPAAVAHWERTLDLDPFHYRASGMLTLALMLLGRLDDAHHRLAVAEHLFPEDPSYRLMRAVHFALKDDMKSAAKVMESAKAQMAPREFAIASSSLELLNLIHHLADITAIDMEALDKNIERMKKLYDNIVNYSREIRDETHTSAGLQLSFHPAVGKSFAELPKVLAESAITGSNNPIARFLGEAVKAHPEGTIYYVRGLALFSEDRFYQAEESFLAAARTPSMSPVRRNALFHALVCEGYLARTNQPKPDLMMKQRALLHMREFLDLGPVRPREAEVMCKVARNCGDLVSARRILADWEKHDGKSFNFLLQKAKIELQSGAYGAAKEAAMKMQLLRPKNMDAEQILADAEKKLRELKN